MKFKIIRSKFLDGLKKVQNIVAGKGSLQIIQNVLLVANDGRLEMTTTDLDISIRTVLACEVIEPGSTTLPVKMLFNCIVKLADGAVEVTVDADNKAIIASGSAHYKISGLPVVDFPSLPAESDMFAYSLQQATLREMLRKTSYATSQDDTRKTLKGVLASFKEGKLTMVATDGRRLAMVEHEVEFPVDAERDIILPGKVVAELQRSLSSDGEVRITVEKSQVSFNIGETKIYSKLLDEVYPNYRQVIPTSFRERVAVDRQQLLSALERANVMSVDETSSTHLTFSANELIVSEVAAQVGEVKDVVPIKYGGETIDIVFNPMYVMDPLKAIDEDEIYIELNSASSPAVIKCSVPFLYVMMPLRIT